MGKIKTHRASAKRYKATGAGKLKMYHRGHRHNLGIKTAKRKRALRKGNYVASARMNDLMRMLPYS